MAKTRKRIALRRLAIPLGGTALTLCIFLIDQSWRQYRPPCSMENLNNVTVPWTPMNFTGVWTAAPVHCSVRPLSADEAHKCLARIGPVVFIGDSVTRYQYMSLAFFLKNASWPAPRGSNTTNDYKLPDYKVRSPCNEKEWPNFNTFYYYTNQFLGTELCDCYRVVPPFVPRETFENRYFSNGQLEVIFYNFFRWDLGLQGHYIAPPPPYTTTEFPGFCRVGRCSGPPAWQYNAVEAMDKVVAPHKPKVLVLNSGLWDSTNAWDPASMEALFRAGRRIVDAAGGVAIWKTTTPTLNGSTTWDHDALARSMAEREGWKIFDAWAFTKELVQPQAMVDNVHFQPFVYNELNKLLLQALCT